MQISELASLSGVSVHAIRHYESLGLIAAARRPSGYREFDDSVIRELRFITMSRQCGFSLAQIAEVLPAYRCTSLTASQIVCRLEERIAEIDAEIAIASVKSKNHTLGRDVILGVQEAIRRAEAEFKASEAQLNAQLAQAGQQVGRKHRWEQNRAILHSGEMDTIAASGIAGSNSQTPNTWLPCSSCTA